MTPRAARLLRGALLGTVATLLAALSHAAGGGPVPSALALVLGGVFATAVGTIALGRVAAGRRSSLVRTSVAVGIAQLAFHLGFSLLATGASVHLSGGHHHGLVSIAADPAAAIAQGGAGMWLAHLLAAIATVLYLRHLEGRVWAVLARVGGILLRVLGIRMPQQPAHPPRPAVSRTPLPVSVLLRDAIARRGPPAALRA
ncbi:MAG: hypothetical protein ACTHMQ_10930 [Protaetiibacter sp.]